MEKSAESEGRTELLRSKRDATRYQILVEIAERQPAVSQREIAGAIDITAQGVSNYLQELIEAGHVEKHGRGRYEITKEGVDWLISRTDNLRSFVDHVSEEVIGEVDVESAIATDDVVEGQRVSLAMRDGALHALPDGNTGATAVAVTDAAAGAGVGLTDFEGVVDYDLGTVTVISVPTVRNGGSAAVEPDLVKRHAANNDMLAVSGVEALVAARTCGLTPDIRFGTPEAVREAATKGLDVLLLVVTGGLSPHTDTLRDGNISYEVVDATGE
jgi:putative transcriptional regulator